MTGPKAEHWCFVFSRVMFRNTFMEETRADNVNYSIDNGGEKGLMAILAIPVSPGSAYLGPGLP